MRAAIGAMNMQKKEHDRGGQRGKTRAAAGLNAGAGLDEGGDGGGAGACACYGADGVCQQSFLHLGHLAVLIEHVCACGGADEGADGVEHVDHAEGYDKGNGGEPADAYEGLEVKLEECGVEHIAERGTKDAVARDANGLVSRKMKLPPQ